MELNINDVFSLALVWTLPLWLICRCVIKCMEIRHDGEGLIRIGRAAGELDPEDLKPEEPPCGKDVSGLVPW